MELELIKSTSASVDERINALLQSGDAALRRYPKPYRQRAQIAYDEALYLLLIKLKPLKSTNYTLQDLHQIRETLIRQLFLRQKISSVATFRAEDIDAQMIALTRLIDELSVGVPDKAMLHSAMSQYYSPRPENTVSFSIDDEVLLSYIDFMDAVLKNTVPGSEARLQQLIDAAQKHRDFPYIIDLSKLKPNWDFEYTKGLLNDLGRKLFNIDAEKITSSLGNPIELLMLLPEMNQKLLERLFQQALETGCEKIIVLLGSVRQSVAADLVEMKKTKQKEGLQHTRFTPSGFKVLESVVAALNKKAGIPDLFKADYTTMTDLHNGLERGKHAEACLAVLNSYEGQPATNEGLYNHYANLASSLPVSCPEVAKVAVAQMQVAVTKGEHITMISTAGNADQIRQALVTKPEAIASTLKVTLTDGAMLTQQARPLTQDVAFESKAKYGHQVSLPASSSVVCAQSGKGASIVTMPKNESVQQFSTAISKTTVESKTTKVIIVNHSSKKNHGQTAVVFKEKEHLHKDHGRSPTK